MIKELTPAQKEWLEIVTPIITEAEREVFLKLKTPQERDRFISIFWKVRDTNPDTEENEFYREYMERVNFADRYFGIGSSKRGCLTERGFYYLLLGKPLERQIFATHSDVWPMELWFYQGDPGYGLPGYFYLIFYQPEGSGDYRLYYPGVEGPEKLVIPSITTQALNRSKAIEILKGINSELAKAAISYLPEDRQDTFSSLSSQSIIAAIKSLPEKKFSSAYVRNYLSYKDLVEVDYSHNYISSSSLVRVMPEGGHYFVHWSVEPDKISFAEVSGTYSAIFELVVRLEDLKGQPVFSRTEEVPLRLNRQQFETRSRQRLAFQDLFPIIPGEYKLLILLKNKTAKDFTSVEFNLKVPPAEGGEYLSPLVLYHSAGPLKPGQVKAFSFGTQEYLVSARNEFNPGEKLQVFCRLLSRKNLSPEARVQLVLRSLDSNTSAESRSWLLEDILSEGSVLKFEPLELNQVKPGYYRLEVALQDGNRVLASVKENLIVLSQSVITAPWVFGRMHRSMPSPEFLKILAGQHFLKGNYEEARKILEELLTAAEDAESRLLLARTLFALGDYRNSLEQALKVFESTRNREAAKVIAIDYVRLKDWASARIYVEQLLSEATEISVLNLAAEIYQNLGEKEKAISCLEKSLSLLPDQPEIKSWLDNLKGKDK
ncbi:MAG: GWxTD domain-containing protein [Candidatus Saccharicenans sp.]|nr:GWxTD domain-containing protein [Candidatus Saccharicenans sp.]